MDKKTSSPGEDYTSGSIVHNLWNLSWPITLSMLLFTFPNTFDGVWLGRLGSKALAAAGLAMSIRITMISPLMALSMAGGAVVARYVGARDMENADKATFHVVLLMIASSGTIGIVGLIFKERLLYLAGARDAVLPLAVQYVKIIFIGLIAMEMVPSLGGVFNAAGNPKVSLRVSLIVGFSTLILEPFLVLGVGFDTQATQPKGFFPGLGIMGASLALVTANTLGTLYAFYVLLTGKAKARINVHNLTLELAMMRRIVRIALPALIHRFTLNLAQTILMRLISAYGTIPLAAYGIVMRVFGLSLIPCTGLARTTGVMVGQNLGAKKPERSEQATYIVAGLIVIIATLIVLILSLSAHTIIGIFNKEPEVIEAGIGLVRILSIVQIFFLVNMAMEGGLVGAADTVSPMVINITTLWLFQLPFIYLLSWVIGFGATGIWGALVISRLIHCIVTTLRFRQGRWKLKQI